MTPRNTQAPSSPTTEAGRDLIARMMILFRAQHESVEAFTADIFAIEQQARDEGRREAVREIREQLPGYMDDLNSEETKGYHFAIDNVRTVLDRVAGLNASESPPTDYAEYLSPEYTRPRRRAGDASESGQPPEASDE